MKKMHLATASLVLLMGFTACDNSGSSTTTTDSSSTTTSNSTNSADSANSSANNTSTATTTGTPLSTQDSTFVMKAAMGGMMEVEGGNTAQQNAANDRVKAFGTMMVNDHSKANSELMSLAQQHGLMVPTTLPADMQSHLKEMGNMKGASFDKHYMGMMVSDHAKDIAEFEKQANNGNDPDLKAWAAKTLPTLRMHADSATAINKAIK